MSENNQNNQNFTSVIKNKRAFSPVWTGKRFLQKKRMRVHSQEKTTLNIFSPVSIRIQKMKPKRWWHLSEKRIFPQGRPHSGHWH